MLKNFCLEKLGAQWIWSMALVNVSGKIWLGRNNNAQSRHSYSQKIYTLTTQTLDKKLLSHLKFSNFPRHIVHYRASFDHLYFLVVDPFVLSPKMSKAFCQLITDKSWISSQDDFLCKTSRRSLILGSLVKSVVCFLFLLNILYSPLICGRHILCGAFLVFSNLKIIHGYIG